MNENIIAAFRAASMGGSLDGDALRAFLPLLKAELLDVMAVARIATSNGGTRPFTCGIVNAKSGLCQEDCAFCSQSARYAANPPVHPLLSEDEMLRRAERFAGAGVCYMGMVTSGTGPVEGELDRLCRMAETISRRVDIRLCASFGILGEGQAGRLAESGFASYHHNLETARSHYPMVCSSHGYELRVQTVRDAVASGLRVCSGGIFGVGESWEQRLELSLELSRLGVHSIPINFLVAVPGTPMAGTRPLDPGEALAIISLFRLMHPGRDIVVCGGRANLGKYAGLLFSAGANGLMVGDYLTTRGEAMADDMAMLSTLGLGT